MKYLIFLLVVLSGCGLLNECEPGDLEPCDCGTNSYQNMCTMDGYFEECNCYVNHEPQEPPCSIEQNMGTMTGGDQTSLNTVMNLPAPICNNDEVGIPGTTICWRICPAGMDWVGDTCIGWPIYDSYQVVEDKCKSYDIRYEIADMDATTKLLNECYPAQFSYYTTNYCSSYLEGTIRYVMKIPNSMTYFDTWIGPLVECDDPYGNIGNNCAWFARLYTRINLSTEFDLLRSSGTFATALASGMCMRGELK